MTTKDFVHLHCHSEFSSDAISSYKELLTTASNKKQKALAITEHQHLGGIVEFISDAKKAGIKPIVGNEFYVEVDGLVTHLTVLANGLIGYNNLVKTLNSGVSRSLATGKDLKRHPVTIDDLFTNSEGLIVLSGCPASMFQVDKEHDDLNAAKLLMKFKDVFGENLFVEGMLSSDNKELMGLSLERSSYLSLETGIPLVITNDVHFAEKHQRVVHDFYVKQVRGFSYPDADLYLKSAEELEYTLKTMGLGKKDTERLLIAMENSAKIADRIETVKFNGKMQLPSIADSDSKFKKNVWDGYEHHIQLVKRGADYEQELKERIDYEMKVILSKGYDTYFLITQELIDVARKRGLAYGKGRGSAAGSAVSFCLGITQINPLDYNLLFERFLNPERDSAPDIDLDLSGEGRDAIIEYANEKYQAVPIVTNSVYGHNSLVRDMAKFFKVDDKTLKALLDGDGAGIEWENITKKHHEWQLIYDTLLGKIRQHGKHAGGIVIDPPDSEYEMPLTTGSVGALSAYSEGTHGQSLGEAGYVKFDILGLKTLNQVQMLEELTGTTPPRLEPDDYDDCFELIDNDELDGTFQLSGYAARKYAMRFKPKSINELGLVTSLARKGALMSGAADEYLKSKPDVGYPYVKGIEPFDSGDLVTITLENDKYINVYKHWQIKLTDNTWKTINELDGTEELLIK